MKNLIRRTSSPNYIQNLQDEMTKLMEETFGASVFSEMSDTKLWRPPLEMSETENNYEIKFQMPGFEKKDIDIEVGNDYITVKGENTVNKEEKGKDLYKSEFRYGNFLRTVSLPSHIVPEEAHAEFKNGVLVVSAKKSKATENVKKIKIKE